MRTTHSTMQQGIVAGVAVLWPIIVSVAYVIGAVWVTVDAVLRKRHVPQRDPRAVREVDSDDDRA